MYFKQKKATKIKAYNNSDTSLQKIEQSVDRYINQRKILELIRKWLIVLSLLTVASMFFGMYASEIITQIESFFLTDVEIHLKENPGKLRYMALTTEPLELYKEIQKHIPENVQREAKYAFLIHRFNNDFYGKSFNLKINDERYLYTHMTYSGFDLSDPVKLNRPFSDDSRQNIREWLFKKTGASPVYSAYYNPIFQKLESEIENLKKKLEVKINRPFEKKAVNSLIKIIPFSDVVGDSLEIIDKIVAALKSSTNIIEEEKDLMLKLAEKTMELDIRLGLFQIFLAHEYDATSIKKIYGWLNNAYKGKEFFNKRYKRGFGEAENELYANAADFELAFKQNNVIYKKLNLLDETIHLYNPLQMPLEVKTIGLFNAHRRNDRGRSYKHRGVDLVADEGTAVYPVREGFIIFAGKTYNGNGNFIKIWHDNQIVTSYSHLKNDAVWERTLARFKKEGPFWVNTLTAVASVGTTGNIPKYDAQYGYPHLHLEVLIKDELQDPLTLFDEAYRVYHD